jgi:uncharacterized Zn-binding protein involved in type VI secretion
MHVCPQVTGIVPHVGGPILMFEPTVLIGFLPAAREGDMCLCVGPPDKIAKGSATVKIGNKPAARMGDPCQHGGSIITGFPNVMIGDVGGGAAGAAAGAFAAAAQSGAGMVCKGPCVACGQL